MFKCERCGSGYNGNYIGVENCPRCMLLDRVQAPLSFKISRMTEGNPEPEPASELPAPAKAPNSEPTFQ